MLANQIFESIDGFCFGNVEFHRGLADVEIDFAGRAADVAEIGVGHFAGPIDDASHDGDLHAFQMQGGCFNFRGRGLQIEQRSSAGWAGHIISFENPRAGRLQNVVGQTERLSRRFLALNQNRVADAVAEQRADVGGSGEKSLKKSGVGDD